ncbi:MAG: SLC13 family permease [Clostridia bacterium]|nr:SLC13 family permease [Clostridia bacterium]
MKKQTITTLIGPIIFLISYFCIPTSVFGSVSANAAIGTLGRMAFWWITGAVDYAVTAFIPIVINALFQITDMAKVISSYASETIMLVLGAAIITASWDETGLDKRISLRFLSLIGSAVKWQVVFWYTICFALSAVLPNAVVCAAMTPIAVSMLKYVGIDDIGKSKTGSLLLVTIAYAAGAGGIASPLGGAMNLVAVDYLEQVTNAEYMYSSWVVRFLPITVVLIVSNIAMLLIGVKKQDNLGGSREYFVAQYKALPKIERQEIISLGLFLIATLLCFTRSLYQAYLPGLKPAYIFITCAVLSFLITKKDGTRIMKWKVTAKKIPWDLIYIFGGGLSIGVLIEGSGAAAAVGELVKKANLQSGYLLVLLIVGVTILLSDVTSNTATAAISFPIVISIISGMKNVNAIPYIYITTIGVNLSYMLPTSIRAVPVGYGLKPGYMFKKGVPITIVSIVIMSVVGYLLLKYWSLFSTV